MSAYNLVSLSCRMFSAFLILLITSLVSFLVVSSSTLVYTVVVIMNSFAFVAPPTKARYKMLGVVGMDRLAHAGRETENLRRTAERTLLPGADTS